jgi:hypothetical protein
LDQVAPGGSWSCLLGDLMFIAAKHLKSKWSEAGVKFRVSVLG